MFTLSLPLPAAPPEKPTEDHNIPSSGQKIIPIHEDIVIPEAAMFTITARTWALTILTGIIMWAGIIFLAYHLLHAIF